MDLDGSGAILCFGEVLLRLSTTPGLRFSNAPAMSVSVGGAESNVAALLAQLGHQVEMITTLPTSGLGELCIADLRRYEIGTDNVLRAEGRLGLYFFEQDGAGGRIVYDRAHSTFAEHAASFDWRTLAESARWFHLSGINLALGGSAAASAVAAVAAMNDAGVPVSFDVNHRASLWAGKSEAELAAVRDVASMADVLFASPFDVSRLLGEEFPNDGADNRSAAAQRAFAAFDRVQQIASTRRSFSEGGQQLAARVDTRTGSHETEPAPLASVIDRIGSGDAFAGAVIDGILRRVTPEQCANAGLSAAVAKHAMFGDRWIGSRHELDLFNPFHTGDVRR